MLSSRIGRKNDARKRCIGGILIRQPYYAQEIRRALKHIMDNYPEAVMMGEDICDPFGGTWKMTLNFSTWYPERVINTPISEAAICGVSTGLALQGWKPIVEIMFYDFMTLCTDQLLNHMCKFKDLWGISPQVLIRTVIGKKDYGVTHSQDLDYIYEKILKVVHPTLSDDVYGCLIDAFVKDEPVLFVEDSRLYKERLTERIT